MRNKILIVDSNTDDREQLEQILQEIVEEGGELIFAQKREDGIAILKKEHPQVVFLDAALIGEEKDWIQEGVHIIQMHPKHELHQKNESYVLKPFKAHQVLEKCLANLSRESVSQIPPM